MTIKILQGDVREVLRSLASDHFDCICTSPPYYGLRSYISDGHPDKPLEIGLEPTLDAYLETMVAVCRELRRVLKPSGVFFLNIGDSYAGSWGNQGRKEERGTQRPINGPMMQSFNGYPSGHNTGSLSKTGLKPKDLCLVPQRLGIALQNDGWWVRSHIIWHKKNPMPESVTDRPTSAHETIWMLTKSERYYWDAEAVAEKCSDGTHGGQWTEGGAKQFAIGQQRGGRLGNSPPSGTRNLRNVWHVASQPFPGAHFATMPPEIAERCIKAASSEKGCCPACGAPWVRMIEEGGLVSSGPNKLAIKPRSSSRTPFDTPLDERPKDGYGDLPRRERKNIGWQPSCKCQELVCPNRCFLLESNDENRETNTNGHVLDVLKSLPPVDKGSEVLLAGVLREQAEHTTDCCMQAVQKDIPAKRLHSKVLQQVLFHEVDGDAQSGVQKRKDIEQPRLSNDLDTEASGCGEVRLHHGASSRDGEEARAAFVDDGSSTPSQRGQSRQPPGEPRNPTKTRARQNAKADVLGDVSEVQPCLPHEGKCPRCGTWLIRQSPPPVPSKILDCFGGAGTTGLVADRLGRDCTMIDLNTRYMDIARDRITDDAPLFVEIAAE